MSCLGHFRAVYNTLPFGENTTAMEQWDGKALQSAYTYSTETLNGDIEQCST